ncbi:MAG: Inner rane transporter permease protein YejB [Bacteroidota bacterium]
MLPFILKRLLFFIPTLLIISLLAFEISLHAPGNAAEMIVQNSQGNSEQLATTANYQNQIQLWKHQLGLDLPVFYFSIHSLATTDTLYKIEDELEQKKIENFQLNNGGIKKYIPTISFYFPNQYHRWLFGDGKSSNGIIHGDFGISIFSQQKISTILKEKMPWSLLFSLLSIGIAYFISLPLGVFLAANKSKKISKIISVVIFILPALPTFWVATMLLMLFSNPDVLNWFPSSGVAPIEGNSTWLQAISYFILPIISFSYGSIAFLTKTMQLEMLNSLNQDYILTAKAKGVSKNKIIWGHAFQNSLLPIITVFANIFPAVLGGSVILETIFSLPGMGRTIYQSIGNHDYNLIVAIFTITGFLTLVGFLVSDILYSVIDPRIRFEK